jgi:hypothetical protein
MTVMTGARLTGAVIDGPLIGQNLTFDYPYYRVAIRPKIAAVTRPFCADEPLNPPSFSFVEYRWDFKRKIWRCSP